MRSNSTARNVVVALCGVVSIGLALTGAAYAISSAAFRYTKPKTGYLTIPAAAFTPQNPSDAYDNFGFHLNVDGTVCFVAPVNLPQNARLARLAMWYSKNDAVQVELVLWRISLPPPAGGSPTRIATLSPVNTGGARKAAAVNITSLRIVNNARFTYFISQCLSDTESFTGARIRYTYTTAGD
jgi:hypothetical protein